MSATYQTIRLSREQIETRVLTFGSGSPLLYLPGPLGKIPERFADLLSENFTVYAPDFPGQTPGKPNTIHLMQDIHDIAIYFDDIVRALGLAKVPVLAESSGAMVALELVANFPERYTSLTAVAPFGLWNEDEPPLNFMIKPLWDLPAVLSSDPATEDAARFFSWATETREDAEIAADIIWSMGLNTKILWPIPDRGLSRRIHRISSPLTVVWGDADAIISPRYADAFRKSVPHAEIKLIPNAGHLVTLDSPEGVISALKASTVGAPA